MYLVTGGTGRVGRYVVADLVASGAPVRITSRRSSLATVPQQVEIRAVIDGVFPLAGVSAVFVNPTALGLFTDPATAGTRLGALIRQAASENVRRIVMLSSAAVLDDGSPVGGHHRDLEQQVMGSGLEWTVLRPGVFNSNTFAWSATVRAEGVVRAPFAEARIAPIDERDIGSVAARALLAEGTAILSEAVPVLSGPTRLTPRDQARIVGEAVGSPVRFEEVPPDVVVRDLINAGEPRWVVEGLLRYYARATCEPVEVSPAVADIIGRPARSFKRWIADHVAAFRDPTPASL